MPASPDSTVVLAAYDMAVGYLSDVYEDLSEVLSESSDVIVSVEDHGEILGEQGFWAHQLDVFPELTHISL